MLRGATALCGMCVVAVCSTQSAERQSPRAVVLYEGARLIPGDGSTSIDDSAFLVQGATIAAVGKKGEIRLPRGATRVDLTGKTVMPSLFSAHGHPGFQKGLSYVRENYTRETYVDDLKRAAYYGVGTVVAQGIDPADLPFQLRAEQEAGTLGFARLLTAGRGIGAPNAGPGSDTYRNIAYEVTSEAQARQSVREQALKKVDVIKIWVDDRNGRAPKLSPALYGAVIDEAHRRGLRVNAHVFYHADAEELVEAGVDGFAHLVRDKEMSAALVAAIVRRRVYVMPNLGASERATHAAPPPWLRWWLEGPLLLRDTVAPEVVQRVTDSFAGRDPAAVERARERQAILQRSLAKLSAAGARIILGSDTGLQDHFFGYAEQRELELMRDAGMTPAQVIVAATARPAEFFGRSTLGTLAPGKSADFLVLDANPLDDIANTRRIASVFLRGAEVDRAALRKAWITGVPPSR